PACEISLGGENATYSGDSSFVPEAGRFVHTTCVPLKAENGTTEGMMVIISDLTDLRDTQQALDASIQRSRTILDTAVDAIITIDEKGIMQSCNASVGQLFGYTADELVGQNVKMLMPSNYAAEHDDYLSRYVRTGERRIIGIGREVIGRRKDGTEFPLHLAVGEFKEDGRQYFTGFIRDMTSQRDAENKARAHLEQLAHVGRLSAIDNLASGISHEVNQPLTAIVTMSQAMLRALRAGRGDRQMLEDTLERIVTQGARANTIVQQMREFARKEADTRKSPHDVDWIINDVLNLLDYEIREYDVEVRTEFKANNVLVNVNRIQIEQVLLNLLQNAVHAMAEVGRDRILTIRSEPPDEYHPYVKVVVSDNGTG
ncbi:MAG: PAS domain S-box protein, partial [Pseudomonadales bacterium]|nr:PAS domain S-box protein [Pseudomonadales bacterium]